MRSRLSRLLLVLLAAVGLVTVAAVRPFDEARSAGPAGTVARGQFERLMWPTVGAARAVRDTDGDVTLVFRGFRTHAAPELYVYLVPGGREAGGDIAGGTKLGRLERVSGDQRYAVPSSFALDRTASVVIWCAGCAQPWGRAVLRPTAIA